MITLPRWTPTVLLCRCGAGLRPADMRRLPPLVDIAPTTGIVVDPIVCPACVATREREIAELAVEREEEDIHAVPSGATS